MYMCAKVYILFLSTIFQLDVRTFPIVVYCILLLFVRHARSKGNKSNLFTHKSFCKILHYYFMNIPANYSINVFVSIMSEMPCVKFVMSILK